jgi:hypothetical protein
MRARKHSGGGEKRGTVLSAAGLLTAAGLLSATLLLLASRAQAQEVSTAALHPPTSTFDTGLILALPASLQTGTSAGVGMGYLRALTPGGQLAWGARASWSTATEYTLTDTVRNDDIRLRLCLGLQHIVGRGSFGLRLGVGATAVYEDVLASQGKRAGLTGSALEHSTWYLLPAADAEGLVFLRIWRDWGMSLSGGPTLHLRDGTPRYGWSSALGVLWQP